MKKIPIIIMGATGRMGTTLVNMVKTKDIFELVGVVEHSGKLSEAQKIGCVAASDVKNILKTSEKSVIVDFTAPDASIHTARAACEYGACHIIGTTGFSSEHKTELEELSKKTPIFWSPNMSIGINVLFKLLPMITENLGDDYDVDILELHHNKKKDAPSGTALRLGECVAKGKNWDFDKTACYHREGIIGERPKEEIGMQTLRGGDVVGTHTVYFIGTGERIELTHHATSRDNFASGALRAAEWIFDKPAGKLYSMQDILK